MKKLNLNKTKQELIEYDKKVIKLMNVLDKCRTEKQIIKKINEWEKLINIVRKVYLEETLHLNNWSQVGVMSLCDIREICTKYT